MTEIRIRTSMNLMSKKDPKAFVTNEVLDETLGEAVETILKGMDTMFKEERKYNSQTFATKEDLKEFATKGELKAEISWIRDDIKGLTGELSKTVSKKDFNQLKSKVDKYLSE